MSVPIGTSPDRRVLIVGGGVAGLAMRNALARCRIAADLVDSADGPPDAGLAINLPGNAVAALRALGLGDALDACGAPVRRREYRNARGRRFFEVDEVRFWGEANAPRCVSRRELIALLGGSVDPTTSPVRWHTEVRTVRATGAGAEVSFADGGSDRYDFVVGADGVHSAVRTSILGEQGPRPSLLSGASWRFMTANPGVDCWCAWSGPNGTLLLIPMPDDRVYGYASATGRGEVSDDPGWLTRTFERYPEHVRRAVSSALREPAGLYHSPVHEVRLPTWHRGAVVLIGDAAHSLAPVWAQGAALAVEDALVLAQLLATRDDWTSLGHEFEERRRPRVQHVQQMTDRLSRSAALPGWLRELVLPVVGPRSYRDTYTPLKVPVVAEPPPDPR